MTASSSERYSQEFADAGRRASDIINGHIVANPWDDIKNMFIAIKFEDGSSDGTLYESQSDAIRHQAYEQQCAYISFRNLVGGANPKEMAIVLGFNRAAYRAGMRLIDPENQVAPVRDLVIPTAGYDMMKNQFAAAQAVHEMRQRAN